MTTTESPRFRWQMPHWGWFLGATIALVVVAGCLFVWLVWLPYHREQQIVQMIENRGGKVDYEPGGPESLRRLVGHDRMKMFDRVRTVRLGHSPYTNDHFLEVSLHLRELKQLAEVYFEHTRVEDAVLVHVGQLQQLRVLNLSGTPISDAGLAHLSALKNLEILRLSPTNITDAGLQHLCPLTNLKVLDVYEAYVTAAGAKSLNISLPKCDIRHYPR